MVKAKVGEIQYMHFTVFAADGTTPLTGQAGACTSDLRKNGATTAEVVTIGEIGVSGYYYASFTPLAEADYDLEVLCTDDRVMGQTWETEVADLDDIKGVVDTIDGNVDQTLSGTETAIIAEIDANEAKIDLIQTDTTQIISDVGDVQTTVDSIETKVDAMQIDVTSIENKIDIIDPIIDQIQLDTTQLLLDTASIESKVDVIDGEIGAIQTDVTQIITDVGAVQTTVDAIKLETAQIILDVASVQTDTTQIISDIATVDGKVDSIQTDTTQIISDVATVDGKVDNIYTDTQAIIADIAACEVKIDAIQADVTLILEDTGTTLPAILSTMEGKIDAIDTIVTAIQAVTDLLPDAGALTSLISLLDEILDLLENQLIVNDTTNVLELYNDAGDTVIKRWPLQDKDGNDIVLVGTGPARRILKTLG